MPPRCRWCDIVMHLGTLQEYVSGFYDGTNSASLMRVSGHDRFNASKLFHMSSVHSKAEVTIGSVGM